MSGDLKAQYQLRYDKCLVPLASALTAHIQENLSGIQRIDRVGARPKSIDRFLAKAAKEQNGAPKYEEPLYQIQDQVGARIIVFYKCDVDVVAGAIKKYYKHIETRAVVPENEWEFGYFGRHYILHMPSELRGIAKPELMPDFFELQIKTLFQHAWSEAEHDLGYKPGGNPLTNEQLRMLAYTSAQAWGADEAFERVFKERTAN